MSALSLEQIATAISIAAVLFVATNIDDVFILLALFANPDFRPMQVVVGQLVGMALIIALSLAAAYFAVLLAPSYVGLLGLVPLGLGIWHLIRRRAKRDDDDALETPGASSSAARIVAAAAITVANGSDNIGVYAPMFATAGRFTVAIYAITMLILTFGLCQLAWALIRHPRLGGPIRKYAGRATPYVLILLGLFILIESRSYAIVIS